MSKPAYFVPGRAILLRWTWPAYLEREGNQLTGERRHLPAGLHGHIEQVEKSDRAEDNRFLCRFEFAGKVWRTWVHAVGVEEPQAQLL